MDSYTLSRSFFDWCFENPEKISPNHHAIYFFAIEHCNRLGWKEKFGFPTQMAMDALGIKKHQTFIKYLNELVEWGFIKMIQKSSNQYSANIISLKSAMPKNGKALDKALIKHGAKQIASIGQSTGQSNSSIDKQGTINKEQGEQPTSTPEDLEFNAVQKWITENAPSVGKMKDPLTQKQYFKLKEQFDPAFMEMTFLQMHNWADLNKKRVSAYLTFINSFAKRNNAA